MFYMREILLTFFTNGKNKIFHKERNSLTFFRQWKQVNSMYVFIWTDGQTNVFITACTQNAEKMHLVEKVVMGGIK